MQLENLQTGLPIGLRNGELFEVSEESRARHFHIIGQTGTGKSTLLKRLIAHDLAAGHGLAFIDSLGHLAEDALSLVPLHRSHEVIYFDAGDLERPLGVNVLDKVHPDHHAAVADDVVTAFVDVWGRDAVGDRSQQILRNAIRALLSAPTGSLLCVPKLLTDEVYRERIVRSIRDPVVLTFFREYARYDERRRIEVTSPILNKLDAVLSAPEMRHVLGQVRSTFEIRRVMDEGRILIVNLRKGRIGEGNAHILGALMVAMIAQAAFAREDTPPHLRRRFYLYADEFQDFASAGVKRVLSQARNMGLALTIAHQFLAQLSDDVRDAVLGNAGTTISFRVGAEDSEKLAAHLGLEAAIEYGGLGTHETEPATLLSRLPNYQTYMKTLADNAPLTLQLDMLPDPPP